MAKAGDRIVVPETGETFIFVQTWADTNGKLSVFNVEVAPGGGAKGAPMHIHPYEEERFVITQGTIRLLMNGKETIHGVGETLVIPAGAHHTWFNAGEGDLHFRLEFEPASKMESLFESLGGLSQRGMIGSNGEISPVIMAVALNAHPDTMYIAGPPIWLQKYVLFPVLGFVGRLVGYKTHYSYNPAKAPGQIKQAQPASVSR